MRHLGGIIHEIAGLRWEDREEGLEQLSYKRLPTEKECSRVTYPVKVMNQWSTGSQSVDFPAYDFSSHRCSWVKAYKYNRFEIAIQEAR